MKTSTVQKNITFTTELFQKIMLRAKALGLDFQDYIRYLTVDDIKKPINTDIDYQKLSAVVEQAEKEYKEEKTKTIVTDQDFKAFEKEIKKASK